jgi:hypothetical protein
MLLIVQYTIHSIFNSSVSQWKHFKETVIGGLKYCAKIKIHSCALSIPNDEVSRYPNGQ